MLEERKIDLDTGIQMTYLFKQGDEKLPPIIMLHGHLMTSDGIREMIDRLPHGNACYAPNLRCSWKNSSAEFAKNADRKDFKPVVPWEIKTGHSVEAYADDIANLISKLNLVKPIIIGGSLGSAVSLVCAKKLGENIKGLGLVCPVLKVICDFPSWIGSIGAWLMAHFWPIPAIAGYLAGTVFPTWPARRKWVYEMCIPHERALIAKSSDALLKFDARKSIGLQPDQKWANPPFRYFAVYGTADSLVYPRQVRILKSLFDFDDANKIIEFKDEGHNLPYTREDEMIELLGGFIAVCNNS